MWNVYTRGVINTWDITNIEVQKPSNTTCGLKAHLKCPVATPLKLKAHQTCLTATTLCMGDYIFLQPTHNIGSSDIATERRYTCLFSSWF